MKDSDFNPLTRELIGNLIREAHQTAKDKGWWDVERTFGDQIALMHSELSEALEQFREHGLRQSTGTGAVCTHPGYLYYVDPVLWAYLTQDTMDSRKPEGIAAEFADVLTRIFDTCGRYGIPLAEGLQAKLAYNRTRPHRHGGKKL